MDTTLQIETWNRLVKTYYSDQPKMMEVLLRSLVFDLTVGSDIVIVVDTYAQKAWLQDHVLGFLSIVTTAFEKNYPGLFPIHFFVFVKDDREYDDDYLF